jgi:hypothetical protein
MVSWLWIPATCAGMAVGLAAGAALVNYGTGRGDVVLLGAVTGVGVGVAQALVLVRRRIPARWPFLVPELARRYADPASSQATREATAVAFQSFHRYLGIGIGE